MQALTQKFKHQLALQMEIKHAISLHAFGLFTTFGQAQCMHMRRA